MGRPGERLNGASVHAVEAFVEKPDAATAASYLADRYLWNSGNFVFHVAIMLREIGRLEPAMAEAARGRRRLTRDFDSCGLPKIPSPRAQHIDRHAVMEKTQLAAVMPADSAGPISGPGVRSATCSRRPGRQCHRGPVFTLDSRNSLWGGRGVLTTAVGVDDLIVVSPPMRS